MKKLLAIALLVLIGIWRHVLRRFPLVYVPEYWGLVFPLGMYSVCTFQLVQATRLTSLLAVAYVMGGIALVAWALTFLALLRRLAKWIPNAWPATQHP